MPKSIVAFLCLACLAACAKRPEAAKPKTAAPFVCGRAARPSFTDAAAGFRISRPAGPDWSFQPGTAAAEGDVATSVTVVNRATGAQVRVEMMSFADSPSVSAKVLTLRMMGRFETTEPEPDPTAEGAVGFTFRVGDSDAGRVVVLTGRSGNLIVLFAIWPQSAPAMKDDADFIIASFRILAAK